ncbi:trypsin-1-like isoform X2 [Panulirus ornatus]
MVMGTSWRPLLAGPARIVGGVAVRKGELPYLVSLQDVRWGAARHFCGGSVYHNSYVITAAHCVVTRDLNVLQVVAGEHDRSKEEGSEQVVRVSEIIVHPHYNHQTYLNDIALLKLSKRLHYTKFVQPIPLAPQRASGQCLVSGWGAVQENGDVVDTPQKLEVPIWSEESCRRSYSVEAIHESMMCAGYEEGGKDACHSDSGGPLVCRSSVGGATYLGGIVSWGYGCARPYHPSIYTDLSYFASWVQHNTVTSPARLQL